MAKPHPFLCLWILLTASFLGAAEVADSLSPLPHTLVGTELGTIKVGPRTYHEVRIKSHNARSLVFTHRGGLASALLRDVSADLQDLLGYDPSKPEPPRPSPVPSIIPETPPPEEEPGESGDNTVLAADGGPKPSSFDDLLTSFGTPPELRPTQNLRDEFTRLSFTVKSQGRRPSCAIFAIMSALEYQNAKATGVSQKLSEEYLIWATRRITGQAPAPSTVPARAPLSPSGLPEVEIPPKDLGYTLTEVVSGLRAFGVAAYFEMPNRGSESQAARSTPDETLIASARTRRLVNILPITGRNNYAILSNIIQALNHGYPVPVSLRWPHERSVRSGNLRDQAPMEDAGHAVTIVGYVCPNGSMTDTDFIFKNSWGYSWGIGGYGRASWAYLEKNLVDAIVLDVGAGLPALKPEERTP